ncbi:selenium cofactor biosynthesis protein YqeC [Vibrio sp. WXL210]|uniref:selenium cofactor biosynthesis protein YqeC n=1 Tax=Vibrio sp. WXL210 TaxID=3450709 RepID=UPI003EC58EF2
MHQSHPGENLAPTNNSKSMRAAYRALKRLITATHRTWLISIVGGGGKTHLVFALAKHFQQQGKRVAVTTTTKMYLPHQAQVDVISQWRDGGQLDHGEGIYFLYQEQLVDSQTQDRPKVRGLSLTQLDRLCDSHQFDVVIVEADGAKHKPLKAPAEHEPCLSHHSDAVLAVTGAESLLAPAMPSQIHRWSQFQTITHCQPGELIGEQHLKRLIHHRQGMFKSAPEGAIKIWIINKLDQCANSTALLSMAKSLYVDTPWLNDVWLCQLNTGEPLHDQLTPLSWPASLDRI